ncbi:TonB-dependent receptor [Sphingomonas sp. H39-1-10]|uniref:TonB-dependent receptor n=1 Tax=Sphingomonas pollutisoli TaxID=3030829 RepID=UPI0023B94F73|nr:TonB-dependent receptor [Sphingomonas pollutisoli]MDF0490164.1 TonB-dependent receptor [Sphingomonas pollutisoli]
MRQWFLMGCGLAVIATVQAAQAQSTDDAPPADRAQDAANGVDQKPGSDIVVTGYRESVEAARDAKRDAVNVSDSIIAEDIAEFPQKNLSEAIQRISGVQITRDYAGGVGNEISIRGLGPDYTKVTINGQSAPTNGDGRTFNFNILPAELFQKITVDKSPTADMVEGGVGGTVALETLRPLSLKKRLFTVSVGGNYNEITGKLDPEVSAVAGGQITSRLGVVGAITVGKFSAASDSYDSVRWAATNIDVNGDKKVDYPGALIMYPRLIHEEQDVRRIAAAGRVEWKPTDNLTILADGIYADFRQNYWRDSPIWNFPAGKTVLDIDVDPTNNAVRSVSFGSVTQRSENHYLTNQSTMYQGTLSAEYKFDRWKLKAFASRSESKQNSDEYVYFGDATGPASYDTTGDNFQYYKITSTDIADPNKFTTSEADRNLIYTRDQDFSAGLELKGPIFPHVELKIGTKFEEEERTRQRYGVKKTKVNEPFSLIGTTYDGFMDGSGSMHSFAIADQDKAYERYGQYLDVSSAEDLTNYFDVDEKTWAGYGMTTYRQGRWLANLGVRVVHTSLSSTGTEYDQTSKTYTLRDVQSDYTDVLPSLNLRYRLARGLFLRAAAARVMSRPPLSNLAAYRVIDDNAKTISASNPDLKPFRANQVDVSAEWYFGKGGQLSVGYFYKDIESFIMTASGPVTYQGETYVQTQPVNGNNAWLQGVEVSYQQPFTFLPGPLSHLGMVANYTFTNSNFSQTVSGTTLTYELQNNSKNTVNIIGYYEDGDFSTRLAYNYRSKYLRAAPNVTDGIKYRAGYGQLDFSARYKLLKGITATVDVLNLLNTRRYEWVYDPSLTDGLFTSGRTVQFSLRASF